MAPVRLGTEIALREVDVIRGLVDVIVGFAFIVTGSEAVVVPHMLVSPNATVPVPALPGQVTVMELKPLAVTEDAPATVQL